MAKADLVPTSPLLAVVQNASARMNIVTQDSTGANINISGWFGFILNIFANGGSGTASPLLASTPTLTGASGKAVLDLTAAQTATLPPGTYTFNLVGKVLTGDDEQPVARGTCQVLPGI